MKYPFANMRCPTSVAFVAPVVGEVDRVPGGIVSGGTVPGGTVPSGTVIGIICEEARP